MVFLFLLVIVVFVVICNFAQILYETEYIYFLSSLKM